MRETREEILRKFPSFSPRKNLVEVWYMDVPSNVYDQKEHEWYESETDRHVRNVCYAKEWIWLMNGDYDIYRGGIGEILISKNGNVLHGSINIPYRGRTMDVSMNLMYGWAGLTILDLRRSDQKVKGFSTKDGIGSTASKRFTLEMDREQVLAILNNPMKDYGYGVQKFMETARQVYEENPWNYIMEKTFELLK